MFPFPAEEKEPTIWFNNTLIPTSTRNDDAIPDQKPPPRVRRPPDRYGDLMLNSVKQDRLLVGLLRRAGDLESLQKRKESGE